MAPEARTSASRLVRPRFERRCDKDISRDRRAINCAPGCFLPVRFPAGLTAAGPALSGTGRTCMSDRTSSLAFRTVSQGSGTQDQRAIGRATLNHQIALTEIWTRGFLGRARQSTVEEFLTETVVTRAESNTLAVALVIVTFSSASAAERSADQQRACEDDALSLCLSEVPSIDRITACMESNLDKLSPPCRAQFETARKGSLSERVTPSFTHRTSKEN